MRITILCILLSFSAFVAADDHAPSPFMPVEIFGCSYNEGKGLDDLLAVGKKWSKWADKEMPEAGFAAVLTPYIFDRRNHASDVYWMNMMPGFERMGGAMDDWVAKGAKLQAQFDEVCSGNNHTLFIGQGIQRPKEGTRLGIMSIQMCTSKEDMSPEKMFAADAQMRAQQEKMGVEGGMMRWFPFSGMSREFDFDFMMIRVASSMKQIGQNMDTFMKNMGSMSSPYESIQECASGEMFAITPVRMNPQN